MLKSVALTGLFKTRDQALRAGEQLRELVGKRGVVRVLFPGRGSSMMEVSVLPANRGSFGVAVGGALFGLVAFSLMLTFGARWPLSLLALGWGVLTGAMLAWWLTGTTDPARTLRGLDAQRCYQRLAGSQRAMVVVIARARREAALRSAIAANSGELFFGVNPWISAAKPLPA